MSMWQFATFGGGSVYSPPANSMSWAGQNGSYWSLSANVASGGSGVGTSGNEALQGGILPSTDFHFDIEIDRGYEVGAVGVNFLGISAGWTPGTGYAYTASGSATWYWSGSKFLDGSNIGSAPTGLVAGRYRFAVDYTNVLLYMKKIDSPTSTIGSMSLPTGWSTSNLRPLLLTQGGYQATATATIRGYATGSGGLF